MKNILFLLTLLALCLFGVETIASTYTVQMKDLSFQPQTITINQGDSVEWRNIDNSQYGGIIHTTTSGTNCTYDGTGWDSGPLFLGWTYNVTFNIPGQYPYFCRYHCPSAGMTGTVIVNPVIIPLPAGQQFISYAPIVFPVVSIDPLQAMPLGIGDLADGGPIMTISLILSQFSGPIDVYAAYAVSTNQSVINLLKPDLTFQSLSVFDVNQALATGVPPAGVGPFIPAATGTINLPDLMSMPASLIPSGTYIIYIMVTPSGTLNSFYLWQTTALVP